MLALVNQARPGMDLCASTVPHSHGTVFIQAQAGPALDDAQVWGRGLPRAEAL